MIKTEETVEDVEGGYKISSRTTGERPDGCKFERKTSYTEITLQPSTTSSEGGCCGGVGVWLGVHSCGVDYCGVELMVCGDFGDDVATDWCINKVCKMYS